MKPEVTYVFEAMGMFYMKHPQVSAPVDADLSALVEELTRSGYTNVTLLRKEWAKWAWPGGYPIFYVCRDGGVLCPDCANDNIEMTADPGAERDWTIDAADINYEDKFLTCDHCNKFIESACGEDEPPDDSDDGQALASAGHGTDEDYGSAEDVL